MTGLELREYRKARGLSQESLARLLDVSVITISRWERGGAVPPQWEAYLRQTFRALEHEEG